MTPFLTQGKTNWKYIIIVLILAVVVGGGILYCYLKFRGIEFPSIKFPEKSEKYSCNIDTDCAIRRVNCSGCGFDLACINKKWVHCELSPPPGESCPPPAPSPSWPKSCKCVNSKCIAKEVIGETANWKIYNSPDNILQARVIPVGKTKESIVEIWTNEGKLLQKENYTSEDGDHGLVVAQAEWTPDSQFFIYSMYSSGGHQPWFSRVYFYSRPNNKIYYFSKVSGFTVASDEFTVTAPDIVTFTVFTSVGMGPTITKSFKLSDIISTLNWNTYRNEELGIEFEYPKNWGEISFKSQKDSKVYTFDSSEETIEAIWYHKPSGIIAFIMRGEKYELVYGGENYQDILKIIHPNKEIKTIYTVSEQTVRWYGGIGNVNISPNGKYVSFILSAYEYSEPLMINIETGQNIFEGLSIWFDDPEKSIYWSPNNNVLAIKSEINEMAGLGICGIFVSDYGDPEKLNEVFSIPWEKHLQGIYMGTVQFIDDEELSFEIEEGIEKYIYNARTKELKKTK